MPAKPMVCPCCDQEVGENFLAHKSSPTHVFHFHLWAFHAKRRALAKDKDGLRLEVTAVNAEKLGLELHFNKNRGKYSIEVTPEQLQSNNSAQEFRCTLYNDRREENMFLTAARILDASLWSSCYDDKMDWIQSKGVIIIKPKEKYSGVLIKFEMKNMTIGSYKIPFAFNLQTEDGAADVTLCRTIVIAIVDGKKPQEVSEDKHKSPFTDQRWDKNVHLIRPYRRLKLLNKYPIPYNCSQHYFNGLKEWKGISIQDYEVLATLRAHMEPKHVTKDNYKDYFHNCLWLEEVMNAIMLHRYNMENVTMKVHGRTELKLEVPGLAEKRPSLIPGDLIRIRIHDDHTGYEGYIKIVEDKHIIIEYVDPEALEALREYPNTEMDVAFQLGRLPLERSHQGVDHVCAKGILKWLFPDDIQFQPHKQMFKLGDNDFLNKTIIDNPEQRTAVEKILNCSSQGAPYIVFGPPGTGKTVTIVEAIIQIMKNTNDRILVCAPANAACDMLASKLIPYCTKKELIRIHAHSRDSSTISKEVSKYSNMSADGDILPLVWKDLLKYRIVVTTLIFIGKFCERDYYPDAVFIDEAAQALETDACVALGMIKPGGRIVLAGDPKQLGPIVQSTVAHEYGLGTSLLERLMETQNTYKGYNPNFITMLKKNFRSHPTILQIPNKLFYESQLDAVSEQPLKDPVSKLDVYQNIVTLHPALKNASGRLCLGQALEFCAVSAKERREGRSPSYFNPAEATMVLEYIKTLIGVHLEPNCQVKPSDIGVITPYIRQVYKIKCLLKDHNFKDIEVGSTEAFQGREKRIIIISTVRAQHDLLKHDKKYALGFVKQEKRFNVAITRAISKLIVIGCPTVLATDPKWKSYMEQCMNLKSYHGTPFEDRTNEKMAQIIERFSGLSFSAK